jgi:hypothetical protein
MATLSGPVMIVQKTVGMLIVFPFEDVHFPFGRINVM